MTSKLSAPVTGALGRLREMNNFWKRTLTILILAPLSLSVLWWPTPLKIAFCVLLSSIAFYEWLEMTGQRSKKQLATTFGIFLVSTSLSGAFLNLGFLGVLAIGLPLYTLNFLLFSRAHGMVAFGGGLYLLITLAALSYLVVMMPPLMMLWLLLTVWGTDIGAYLVGRWLKGPKLAPKISPNKTWAGFIGGVVSGILVSMGFFLSVASENFLNFKASLVLGGVISLSSHLGDLLESMAKRHFNVKDSGKLIPGHGGILDRIDGLLLASLVLWCLLYGAPVMISVYPS